MRGSVPVSLVPWAHLALRGFLGGRVVRETWGSLGGLERKVTQALLVQKDLQDRQWVAFTSNNFSSWKRLDRDKIQLYLFLMYSVIYILCIEPIHILMTPSELYSFIHASNKYLSSTYYVPGAVLGAGDAVRSRTQFLPSWGLQELGWTWSM